MPKKKQIRRVIKNSNQEATVGIEMKSKNNITTSKKSKIITSDEFLDCITGNKIIDINSLPRSRSLSTDSLKSSSSEVSYDKQTRLDNIKNEKELFQEEKMKRFMDMVTKNREIKKRSL